MTKIKPLATSVIQLIAAGEVADQPVLILKELLENSLDAGATKISIELLRSGLEKITVTDNGEGMSAEDLQLAALRHTTSKISTIDDLSALHFFGFRGEALASIAQVSSLSIKSKTETAEHGHMVKVTPTDVSSPTPIGMMAGTVVEITQLYDTLPVRKKFLKKPHQQVSEVLALLQAYATEFHQLSFQLKHNQQTIFKVVAQSTKIDRIREIWGTTITNRLLEVEVDSYIGKPQLARRSSNTQLLFINHRLVTDRGVAQSVKKAYGTSIAGTELPWFYLSLQVPLHEVDANIHPHKQTVRLSDTEGILNRVKSSVAQTLAQNATHYIVGDQPTEFLAEAASQYGTQVLARTIVTTNAQHQLLLTWQPGQDGTPKQVQQLHQTYLLWETGEGITLLDQHAAHERILYEQIMANVTTAGKPITREISPILLESTPQEKVLLQYHQEMFSTLGFELEEFGLTTFKILSAPSFIKENETVNLIKEILGLLADEQTVETEQVLHQALSMLACKSAIKAGEFLTVPQREELLRKLAQTPHFQSCPHGRPTTVTLSFSHLEKLFKRSS
ncbi:MAG: DNA mismatch repair endonuclease MutL [bacterium]|nr:DNA mismatch repair endonuclease MutL [bacterium]